ncbi:MAG: DUF368 domain-containing protein [Anaeroplasmataceae bacterium]|nr:DUF368 domain-containing protein [Anaeroplasmataceae bacterium]
MKYLVIFLKGILLGFVSLAIPGLSASTIALEVGVYYLLINSISNIFKDFKKSITFLGALIAGYVVGCAIGAISIDVIYEYYPMVMTLLILGFILGGIPYMAKELKTGLKKPSCWISMAVVVVILLIFSFVVTEGKNISFNDMDIFDYVLLVIVGFITASTLVVPGVDFAVLMIALGYYYPFIGLISNIFHWEQVIHTLMIFGFYLAGYLVGCFIFAVVIKKMVVRFQTQTKFASFGFVLVAPVIVIKKNIFDNPEFFYTTPQIIVGSILAVIGFLALFFLPKPKEDLSLLLEGESKESEENVIVESIVEEKEANNENEEVPL